MNRFISKLESDARQAATERNVNFEKLESFIQGAKWTIEQFEIFMSVHPMEDAAKVTNFMDSLRLKDVRDFIRAMRTKK